MKKAFLFIIACSLLLTSLAFSDDVRAIRVERLDVPDFVGYVPNEIVVKFDPSITAKMDKTKALKGLMVDYDDLYDSLIKDQYYLGMVLGKKYNLLRRSYTIFMFGLIISVLSFIFAAIYQPVFF